MMKTPGKESPAPFQNPSQMLNFAPVPPKCCWGPQTSLELLICRAQKLAATSCTFHLLTSTKYLGR